jgi:chorismate dehydratase
MSIVRIGAVSYLNARPLVVGLESRRDRFAVRYDLPSTCARLLHSHEIDLGLIPSIEYLRGEGYAIVPDCAVASDGPVASVALFTKVPIEGVRTVALDTSSRTSVALTRVMTAKYFDIAPRFIDEGPDLELMVQRADAALLIGDPALFADHRRMGLDKIDLGQAWKDFTGLPFVYACWTGRPGALTADDVALLQ